jgi:hypothetical protein
MAYTTIDDGSPHFQNALYTGNGNAGKEITLDSANYSGEYVGQAITPDFIWGKCLNLTQNHNAFDSSRGITTKRIAIDEQDAENDDSTTITAVSSDSITLGNSNNLNNADDSFVMWLWAANGGSRTTFTESGNNPGGYQANTTAGFSIVDYVGTGSAGTVSHGLGAAPEYMIVKNRNAATDWAVYHRRASSAGNDSYLQLNNNSAVATAGTVWNDTSPSSSVFTVGTNTKTNTDSQQYIAYVYAPIQGYSKFGSYTGNGNNDGPFIYLGFRPAWFLLKRIDANANWLMYDNKRDPDNRVAQGLFPNLGGAETEQTGGFVDFVSNGVKCREDGSAMNASGGTFVYLAFAEQPFKFSNAR